MIGKSVLLLSGALLTAGAGVLGFTWPFGRASESLRLPGTVETQEVRLGSKLGGRVASVFVAEGDVVEAGQILARFEAPELQAQQQQLQARLQAAEAELDRARNGARSEEIAATRAAVEAARAALDRLKAGPRPEEIRQAQGDLDRHKPIRSRPVKSLPASKDCIRWPQSPEPSTIPLAPLWDVSKAASRRRERISIC